MASLYGVETQSVSGLKLVKVDVPETYEKATGIAVDLHHEFREIFDVWVMRGTRNGYLIEVTEEDNDKFSNGKFIIRVKYPQAPVTPKGTNSAPVFKGDSSLTSGNSAGKVEGKISQALFTGKAAATTKDSAGIPSGKITEQEFFGSPTKTLVTELGSPKGSISKQTFEGRPLDEHTHIFYGDPQPLYPDGSVEKTIQEQTLPVPYGRNGRSLAGLPEGEVSQATFEGVPLGGHAHDVPAPHGKISRASFEGAELPGHGHEVTVEGEINVQTFEGAELSSHTHKVEFKGSVTAPEFQGELVPPQAGVEIEEGKSLREIIGRIITFGVIGI